MKITTTQLRKIIAEELHRYSPLREAPRGVKAAIPMFPNFDESWSTWLDTSSLPPKAKEIYEAATSQIDAASWKNLFVFLHNLKYQGRKSVDPTKNSRGQPLQDGELLYENILDYLNVYRMSIPRSIAHAVLTFEEAAYNIDKNAAKAAAHQFAKNIAFVAMELEVSLASTARF